MVISAKVPTYQAIISFRAYFNPGYLAYTLVIFSVLARLILILSCLSHLFLHFLGAYFDWGYLAYPLVTFSVLIRLILTYFPFFLLFSIK